MECEQIPSTSHERIIDKIYDLMNNVECSAKRKLSETISDDESGEEESLNNRTGVPIEEEEDDEDDEDTSDDEFEHRLRGLQNQESINVIVTPELIDCDVWLSPEATISNDNVETVPSESIPIDWQDNKPPSFKIPFTGKCGFRISLDEQGQGPIDFFNLLFNDEFFNMLQLEVNASVQSMIQNGTDSPKPRKPYEKQISREDLDIFLGLLFLMGNIRVNKIQYYWKKNRIYNFVKFSQNMSRDRFLFILKSLNCSQSIKSHSVLELFLKNMSDIYYPNKELVIDEPLIMFKERLIRQSYLANKNFDHDLKLYNVSEPNGIILNMIATNDVQSCDNIDAIVKQLLHNYFSCGHSVYMNELYNSVSLSHEFLYRNTYTTGKLSADRTYMPALPFNHQLKMGQSAHKYTKMGLCLLRWYDDVEEKIHLSSEVDAQFKRVKMFGRNVRKPAMLCLFDKFYESVDRLDQLMDNYPLEKCCIRPDLKVAIHIFHVMLNNCFLFHSNLCDKELKLSRFNFRNTIIEYLLYRNRPQSPDNSVQGAFDNDELFGHTPVEVTDKRNKRKRCRICHRRGFRKNTSFYCPSCPGNPGLCLIPCFQEYHRIFVNPVSYPTICK